MVSSVRGTDSDVLVYNRILSSALSEKASSIVKSGFLKGILSFSTEMEASGENENVRSPNYLRASFEAGPSGLM